MAAPDSCNFKIGVVTAEDMDKSPSADLRRVDKSRVEIYLNAQGGTSLKNIVHMGQILKYKRFARYNYGWSKGWEVPLD